METFFCVSILATQTKRQKMFDLLKRKKLISFVQFKKHSRGEKMDKKWREQKENIFIERVVVVAVVDVLIQNFKLVTIEHANEFNLVGSWDTFYYLFSSF